MAIFEEVVLAWEGKEYRLPPDMVLRAIARVEGILSMADMAEAETTRKFPLGKMSMAMGAVLRMAGCEVSDDAVYLGMFKDAQDMPRRAWATLRLLQLLMIPPEKLREAPKKDEAAKPAPPAESSLPATGSSSVAAG